MSEISIERDGIRVERHGQGDDAHATITNVATGAKVTMTLTQAHEALAGLTIALGRYDLTAAHKYAPQRRTQPGTQPGRRDQ